MSDETPVPETLETIAGNIQSVGRIVKMPEAVMQPVYPDVHEHEEIPGLGLHQVLD